MSENGNTTENGKRTGAGKKPGHDGEAAIRILALGPGWLAVDKPAGVSVHNEPGQDLLSRARAFLDRDAASARQTGFDAAFGVQAVHRLDRDTSGLLLLACQADTFRYFSAEWEARRVVKAYWAILHGHPSPLAGVWDWPLSAGAAGRNHPAGTGPLLESRTDYRVTGLTRRYALVLCRPHTGRNHQIRRHARLSGHAVAGDARYGTPRSVRFLKERLGFDRVGLHAAALWVRPPEAESPRLIALAPPSPDLKRLLAGDDPLPEGGESSLAYREDGIQFEHPEQVMDMG